MPYSSEQRSDFMTKLCNYMRGGLCYSFSLCSGEAFNVLQASSLFITRLCITVQRLTSYHEPSVLYCTT